MKIKPINIIIIFSSVIIILCLIYVFLMNSKHQKIQKEYSEQEEKLLEYEGTKNFINSRITEIEQSVQGFRLDDIDNYIDTLLKYRTNIAFCFWQVLVADRFIIPSNSMYPTLQQGDN